MDVATRQCATLNDGGGKGVPEKEWHALSLIGSVSRFQVPILFLHAFARHKKRYA